MKYDLKDLLDIAEKGNFAVPAFNIYTMENVISVMEAAEETGSPVIFQMYSRLFDSGIARFIAPAIHEAMNSMKVPAAFHIDHGAGEPQIIRALRYGATGVMIDASSLPFEENLAKTRKVVEMATEAGVSVEGELGHIGSTADEKWADYTNVDEAVDYVNRTGVKALAIMVGTAHGHYAKAPVLAIDRIKEIHAATDAHLVLHGGSGVPDDQVRAAIEAGIRKINFGTDVCCTYHDACSKVDKSVVPIDLYLRASTQAVKEFAIEKMQLLGGAR